MGFLNGVAKAFGLSVIGNKIDPGAEALIEADRIIKKADTNIKTLVGYESSIISRDSIIAYESVMTIYNAIKAEGVTVREFLIKCKTNHDTREKKINIYRKKIESENMSENERKEVLKGYISFIDKHTHRDLIQEEIQSITNAFTDIAHRDLELSSAMESLNDMCTQAILASDKILTMEKKLLLEGKSWNISKKNLIALENFRKSELVVKNLSNIFEKNTKEIISIIGTLQDLDRFEEEKWAEYQYNSNKIIEITKNWPEEIKQLINTLQAVFLLFKEIAKEDEVVEKEILAHINMLEYGTADKPVKRINSTGPGYDPNAGNVKKMVEDLKMEAAFAEKNKKKLEEETKHKKQLEYA